MGNANDLSPFLPRSVASSNWPRVAAAIWLALAWLGISCLTALADPPHPRNCVLGGVPIDCASGGSPVNASGDPSHASGGDQWSLGQTWGVYYNPTPYGSGAGNANGSSAANPPVITMNWQDCAQARSGGDATSATGSALGITNPVIGGVISGAGGAQAGSADLGCQIHNLGEVLHAITKFFGNPLGAMAQWFTTLLSGDTDPSHNPMVGIINGNPGFIDSPAYTDNMYSRLWTFVLYAAGAMMAIAALLRLWRLTWDGQRIQTVLPDMLPRLVLGAAAMGMSYQVLGRLTNVSGKLAKSLMTGLLGTAASPGGNDGSIGALVAWQLQTTTHPDQGIANGLTALAVIVCLVLFLYIVMMLLLRFVMLVFCVIISPAAIATAVYDVRNNFFQKWWKMTLGSLIVTPLMGLILGMTFALALGMKSAYPTMNGIGALGQLVMLIAGFWFLGKVVHGFTLEAFHGMHFSGALGALEGGALLASGARMRGLKEKISPARRSLGGGTERAGGGISLVDSASTGHSGGRPLAGGGAPKVATDPGAQSMADQYGAGVGKNLRNKFEGAVGKGLWWDELKAWGDDKGMEGAPPRELVGAFLEEGEHARIVHDAFGAKANDSFIDHQDPENQYAAVMARHGSPADPTDADGFHPLDNLSRDAGFEPWVVGTDSPRNGEARGDKVPSEPAAIADHASFI